MGVTAGRAVVAAAGTAVPLSADSVAARRVVVTAGAGNTGAVVIGGDGVVAALADRTGTPLFPDPAEGATQATLDGVDDLSKVFVDAVTNDDEVTYTAIA